MAAFRLDTFGVRLFEKTETAVEPAPTDYLEACHARMRAAKAVLDEIDAEMLAFKTRYKIRTDRHGRLLGCESQTIGGRAAIEREWFALLRRRDAALTEFYASTHEWSDAKDARERERKVTV